MLSQVQPRDAAQPKPTLGADPTRPGVKDQLRKADGFDQGAAMLVPGQGGGAAASEGPTKSTKVDVKTGAATSIGATHTKSEEKSLPGDGIKTKESSTGVTVTPAGGVSGKHEKKEVIETGPSVVLDPKTGLYVDAKNDKQAKSSGVDASHKDGKTKLNYSHGKTTTMADGSADNKSGGAGMTIDHKTGGVSVSGTAASSQNDKTGAGSGQSTTHELTFDPKAGNVGVGKKDTQTTKNADGTSSSKSTSKSAGLQDGKLGGSTGTTTATTNKEGTESSKSTSASGGIGFGKVGGSLNASGGHKNDKTGANSQGSAGIAGGYTVDGKIVKEGDKFAVYWARIVEVKPSAGGGGGNTKTEQAASGKIGAQFEIGDSGKKVFATEKKAKEFLLAAKATFGMSIIGASDARGASTMDVGESWAKGASFGMSVGVDGQLGGLSIGASGSIKGSQGAEVKRSSKDEYAVTRFHQSDAKGAVNLGFHFVTLSGAKGSSRRVQVTMKFDLKSEDSKKNFDAYVKDGKLINNAYVQGAEEIIDTTTGEKGLKFDALGASMSITNKSTVEETETVENGKTTKSVKGTNDKGYSVDLWGLYKEGHSAKNALAGTSKGDGIGISTDVAGSGSGGKANLKDLAAATPNAHANNAASKQDIKSSGTWTLSTIIDESLYGEAMNRLMKSSATYVGLFGKDGQGPMDELIASMNDIVAKNPGKSDKIMETRLFEGKRVLARWVAKYGAPAARVVRAAARAEGTVDTWVSLKPADGKKDVFLKPGEVAAFAKRAIEYRETLKKSPEEGASVASQAASDKSDLEQRLVFMTHDYYPDCPDELIEEQRVRALKLVKGLDEIVDGVRGRLGDAAESLIAEAARGAERPGEAYKVFDGLRAQARKDDRSLRVLMYEHDQANGEMDKAGYDKARDLRLTAQKRLAEAYADDPQAEQAWLMYCNEVLGSTSSRIDASKEDLATRVISMANDGYRDAVKSVAAATKAWSTLKASHPKEFSTARKGLPTAM